MYWKIFERASRELLGKILLKKMAEKTWGEFFREPMNGVSIFLRSVENLWGILGSDGVGSRSLKSMVKFSKVCWKP
jgi:hypothetical protein